MLTLLLVACGSPTPAAPDPTAPVAEQAEPPAPVDASPAAALEEQDRRLAELESRLARLELTVAELQALGVQEAAQVRYDPSRTTLAARTVQEALTELHTDVAALRQSSQPTGTPGPGLFAIPSDGAPGQGPGPGGRGTPGPGQGSGQGNGPPGPPPPGSGGPAGTPPNSR